MSERETSVGKHQCKLRQLGGGTGDDDGGDDAHDDHDDDDHDDDDHDDDDHDDDDDGAHDDDNHHDDDAHHDDDDDDNNDDDDDNDDHDDIKVTAELERTRCVLQSRDEEVEALTREVLFDFVKTKI